MMVGRRKRGGDVKSGVSRVGFRLHYVLITATGGFRRFVKIEIIGVMDKMF